MIKEFKDFIMRGNVLDMAIGIIIGSAFGTIIKSLVADVLMPPIGLLLGGVDFSNLFITLKQGAASFYTRSQCKSPEQSERNTTRKAYQQRVSLLLHNHSDQSRSLPALHFTNITDKKPTQQVGRVQ